MKESDIIKSIKSPGLLQNININELKKLVDQFPFYQTAHILLLKSLKDQNSDEFENQLAKSSIYISDRDILFRFLQMDFVESVVLKENQEKEQNVIPDRKVLKGPVTNPNILKNRNVKRKINDSFEGMGENISETISSQLEFSVVKNDDKLEYPSEIYFIEEERNGKNNILTIDADPSKINLSNKKKDILFIDEDKEQNNDSDSEPDSNDESFELIEIEKSDSEEKQEMSKQGSHFDISKYADEDVLAEGNDLISSFIKKKPQIKPVDSEVKNEDISTESVEEDSELLSETLIKVYVKQGLFDKAIQSYEKLSLKYPEKNVYFASQIEILQDKINKQ